MRAAGRWVERLLAVGLCALGAGPVAASGLPRVTLQVELRWRDVGDEPPTGGVPALADRAVSTARESRSGVAVTSVPGADQARRLIGVMVRNGEQARVQLTRQQPRQALDWVWTAAGQGLVGGTRFDVECTSLVVQPAWAGRQAAVDLRWRLGLPNTRPGTTAPSSGVAAVDHAAFEGRLDLPMGRWTELARLRPAAASRRVGSVSSADAVPPAGEVVEVRVSLR